MTLFLKKIAPVPTKSIFHFRNSIILLLTGALVVSVIPSSIYLSTARLAPILIGFSFIIFLFNLSNRRINIRIGGDITAIIITIALTFISLIRVYVEKLTVPDFAIISYIGFTISHFVYILIRSKNFSNRYMCEYLFKGIIIAGSLLSILTLLTYLYLAYTLNTISLVVIKKQIYLINYYVNDVSIQIDSILLSNILSSIFSYYGHTMEMAVPISVVSAMVTVYVFFEKQKTSAIWICFLIVNILTLVVLTSRGAIISYIISVGVSIIILPKKRSVMNASLFIIIFFTLYALFLPTEYNPLLRWIKYGGGYSTSIRTAITIEQLEMALLHPLGSGLFAVATHGLTSADIHLSHGALTRTLFDLGLIGALPLLYLMLTTIKNSWIMALARYKVGNLGFYAGSSPIELSIFAGMVCFAIAGLFNDIQRLYSILPLFFLLAIVNNLKDNTT